MENTSVGSEHLTHSERLLASRRPPASWTLPAGWASGAPRPGSSEGPRKPFITPVTLAPPHSWPSPQKRGSLCHFHSLCSPTKTSPARARRAQGVFKVPLVLVAILALPSLSLCPARRHPLWGPVTQTQGAVRDIRLLATTRRSFSWSFVSVGRRV